MADVGEVVKQELEPNAAPGGPMDNGQNGEPAELKPDINELMKKIEEEKEKPRERSRDHSESKKDRKRSRSRDRRRRSRSKDKKTKALEVQRPERSEKVTFPRTKTG